MSVLSDFCPNLDRGGNHEEVSSQGGTEEPAIKAGTDSF
jgi:hypothetical protein